MPTLDSVPAAPRHAEPGAAISIDELRLASRNHALPMEALRHDVTPTGLHYLLTHYDIPDVDPDGWTLTVDGLVERPLTLGLADLQRLPQHTVRVTMECAGNGRATLDPRPVSQPWLNGAVGTADWSGVRLRDLLAHAGVDTDSAGPGGTVVFTGLDHGVERGVEQDYQRSLALPEALGEDVLVAHAMNGAPLLPQHGAPARVVVPGWYGMGNVKWLARVTVRDEPFESYQDLAYRLRQHAEEPGRPVTRIEPRALLVPPGFPDFVTRTRVLRPGPVTLEGRAWSGWAPVERVEVSTDGGGTWQDAVLDPPVGRWAWRRFSLAWRAEPGEHLLRVRAHDGSGRVQAVEPEWNRGGFAVNADQGLPCVVLED